MNEPHSSAKPAGLIWRGLPSVCVLLLMVLPVLSAPFRRESQYARYRDLMIDAVGRNDFETIHLFLPKAISLGGRNDARISLIQAEMEGLQGHDESASRIMQTLAASGSEVSGEAHLWLAKRKLRQLPVPRSPDGKQNDASEEVLAHLKAVIRLEGQTDASMEAHLLLGKLLLESSLPEAIQNLEIAITQRPEADLLLAEAYEKQGDSVRAVEFYANAQRRLSQKVSVYPRATKAVLELAFVCRKLGNFLQSEEFLQSAIRRSTDETAKSRLRCELAESWVAQAREIESDQDAGDIMRLRSLLLVERAIKECPESKVVCAALLDLVHRNEKNNHARFLLSKGVGTALLTLLRAFERLKAAAPDEAEQFFREASSEIDRFPVVMERLTWFLTDQADLDAAGQLCEQIRRIYGQSPHRNFFSLTIGRLELMRGNFDAAVRELENAVELRPDNTTASDYLSRARDGRAGQL